MTVSIVSLIYPRHLQILYFSKFKKREKELIDLCNKYKSNNNYYDCIVPGSGGKDSFYTSHILKYKYGMNPLTITWAPHMYTEWGI